MKTEKKKRYIAVGIFLLGAMLISGCTQNKRPEIANKDSETSQSTKEKSVHDHQHKHTHDGEFEEADVQNRTLQDWSGDWQSSYPYLLDGTLDEVLEHKAEEKKDKSFAEYKEYYTTGYKTDTQRIKIKENTIEFFKGETSQKAEYKYDGYKILTYDSGKKGVRYLFSTIDENSGAPKHIQCSDHNIKPTKAEHFHLYFGDESQDTLLKELENWPTYYKSDLSGADIVHDMMHHH